MIVKSVEKEIETKSLDLNPWDIRSKRILAQACQKDAIAALMPFYSIQVKDSSLNINTVKKDIIQLRDELMLDIMIKY